jgi:hypothetical protein
MGSRAMLVIAEGGRLDLRYSHWAAQTLPSDLFWGPELAIDFVRRQTMIETWLDDAWCEGGAVIEPAARRLVFFGGEDIHYELPLRRAFMELMGVTWPGWSVAWATRGIVDLAAAVGKPATDVLSAKPLPEPSAVTPADAEPPSTVITTNASGSVRSYGTDWPVRIALDQGPEAFARLDPSAGASTRTVDPFPRGGIDLDVRERKIGVWAAAPIDWLPRIAARWPGWSLQLHEGPEAQLASAAGNLEFAVPNHDELLSRLESILGDDDGDPVDSFRQSIEALRGAGYRIENVNPDAYVHASAEVDVPTRRAILHRALARVRRA